jgi:hypothetical protein
MKPIAWYDPTNGMVSTDKDSPLFTPLGQVLPLYTQHTWVELDEEDYIKAYELCDFDKVAAFDFFESKLKEKNNG